MILNKVGKSFNKIKPEEWPHTIFSLDLGSRQDHSVLLAATRHWVETGEYDYAYRCPLKKMRLTVEDIRRWPLRTYYEDIVGETCQAVRDYADQIVLVGQLHCKVTLITDATGVGLPIAEMFERASLPCQFVPITITSGERVTQPAGGGYGVPRSVLLSYLRLFLERDHIRIPRSVHCAVELKRELHNLTIGRQVAHDDLAMALAQACWRASQIKEGPRQPPNVLR